MTKPLVRRPSAGERVWMPGRTLGEINLDGRSQPNGKVKSVRRIYGETIILVEFFDEQKTVDVFDLDDFEGRWDPDAFGGTWMWRD
jgi:hypothetical protein